MKDSEKNVIEFLQNITKNPVDVQLELSRHNEYCNCGELIKDKTFIIPMSYLEKKFPETFGDMFESIDQFLDVYDSETDGVRLFNLALEDKELIDSMQSIDKDGLLKIARNTLVEVYRTNFYPDTDGFKDYLIKEIGVTEEEWKLIELDVV